MNRRAFVLSGASLACVASLSGCYVNEWDWGCDGTRQNSVRQYRDGKKVFEPKGFWYPRTEENPTLHDLLDTAPFPAQARMQIYNAQTLVECGSQPEDTNVVQTIELRQLNHEDSSRPSSDFLKKNGDFLPMNPQLIREKTLEGIVQGICTVAQQNDWIVDADRTFDIERCLGLIWGNARYGLEHALEEDRRSRRRGINFSRSILRNAGLLFRGDLQEQYFVFRSRRFWLTY
jgi:hypothetical protein